AAEELNGRCGEGRSRHWLAEDDLNALVERYRSLAAAGDRAHDRWGERNGNDSVEARAGAAACCLDVDVDGVAGVGAHGNWIETSVDHRRAHDSAGARIADEGCDAARRAVRQ